MVGIGSTVKSDKLTNSRKIGNHQNRVTYVQGQANNTVICDLSVVSIMIYTTGSFLRHLLIFSRNVMSQRSVIICF